MSGGTGQNGKRTQGQNNAALLGDGDIKRLNEMKKCKCKCNEKIQLKKEKMYFTSNFASVYHNKLWTSVLKRKSYSKFIYIKHEFIWLLYLYT